MSKSEWTELPDWRDESAYSFLDNASLEVWAWEFLRRNQGYREDWAKAHGCNNSHSSPKKYSPLIKKGDARYDALVKSDLRPTESEGNKLAKKWGIRFMASPEEPLPKKEFFSLYNGFPHLIKSFEDLEPFMLDEDVEFNDGNGMECVARPVPDKAIMAFDLTKPLDKQVNEALSTLIQKQRALVEEKVSENKTSGHKNIWVRHLRVIDARRSSPEGKYREISAILGGVKLGDNTHEKRGEKFIIQAEAQMKNYRKVLFHSSAYPKT